MTSPCSCVRLALLAISFLLTPALVSAQGQPSSQPAKTDARIVFDKQTLFSVYASVGSFRPADRARVISNRLRQLADDTSIRLSSLTVSDTEGGTEILAENRPLVSITDADAQAVGLPRQQAVAEYLQKIRTAIGAYRQARSARNILLGVLYSLLATLIVWIVFKFIGKLFAKVCQTMESWHGTRIRAIKIQSSEIITAAQITQVLLWLVNVFRLAVTLALLYLYLTLVFGFFPWTKGYAATLLGYIGVQLKAVWRGLSAQIPNLIFITIILLITRYLLKGIRFCFAEIATGAIRFEGFEREWADPTYKIVRFLALALAAIAIFPYVPGSDSPAFKGISVFLGVLFSLGSTAAVANIVAGVVLTYMRPFQIGDRVKIADTVGDVIEKSLLVTRVRTIKNVDVTVPNALVLGTHILNYSSVAQERGLILHTSVTIGYDAPWRQVHELLIAAAQATEHILGEPTPFVLQTSLDDFYVSYELNAYTNQPNRMAVIFSELHQNVQDKFNAAGVEIMSPHYSALRDGNQTTIPPDHLPDSYEAPAFRIVPTGNSSQKPHDGSL